jgi:hypothetical protein
MISCTSLYIAMNFLAPIAYTINMAPTQDGIR